MREISGPDLLKIDSVIPATASFRITEKHSRKDIFDMTVDLSGFTDKMAYTLVYFISAFNNDRRGTFRVFV